MHQEKHIHTSTDSLSTEGDSYKKWGPEKQKYKPKTLSGPRLTASIPMLRKAYTVAYEREMRSKGPISSMYNSTPFDRVPRFKRITFLFSCMSKIFRFSVQEHTRTVQTYSTLMHTSMR